MSSLKIEIKAEGEHAVPSIYEEDFNKIIRKEILNYYKYTSCYFKKLIEQLKFHPYRDPVKEFKKNIDAYNIILKDSVDLEDNTTYLIQDLTLYSVFTPEVKLPLEEEAATSTKPQKFKRALSFESL